MGLRRIVFPVAALVLVMIARELLRPYMPVALLNLAVPLFLSLALVRAIVFSLRYAFFRVPPGCALPSATSAGLSGAAWRST